VQVIVAVKYDFGILRVVVDASRKSDDPVGADVKGAPRLP
jgi:hypothetical protein